jgi:hypothetical protein
MRIFSLLGIVRKYHIIDDEGLSKDMGIGMIECGHGHGHEMERDDQLMYIYAVSAKGHKQIKKILNLNNIDFALSSCSSIMELKISPLVVWR